MLINSVNEAKPNEHDGIRTSLAPLSLRSLIRIHLSKPIRSSRPFLAESTSTMGFEPTTIGLEVRRSILAELRALGPRYASLVKKQSGFGFTVRTDYR